MRALIVCLFLLLTATAFAQKTLIYCGQLIDVKKNEMQKEMTILVEGNKIIEITKGYKGASSADKTIDLKSKTVMPGFIDMHVHLEHETQKGELIDKFVLNPADMALQSTKYAKTTLMAGFTSVRDLGGTGVNISLRNAINKGNVDGPRIYTAGKSIATTGGHADPTNEKNIDLLWPID